MATAVLLITRLQRIVANGTLLAIGDDGQVITFHPKIHQIIAHGFGPLLPEHEIVRGGPPLIAMAFHFQLGHAVCTQPFGISLEDLLPFLADRPTIVAKEDISKACRGRGRLFGSQFRQLSICGGGVSFGIQSIRAQSLSPTEGFAQGPARLGAREVTTRFPTFGRTTHAQ